MTANLQPYTYFTEQKAAAGLHTTIEDLAIFTMKRNACLSQRYRQLSFIK